MREGMYAAAFVTAISILLLSSVPAFSMKQSELDGQPSGQAENAIKGGKEKPQLNARAIIKKYGAPQEVTSERLIWHNN